MLYYIIFYFILFYYKMIISPTRRCSVPKIIYIVHQSSAEADLGFSLRGLLLVKI